MIYPPILVMESHAEKIVSSKAFEKGRDCLQAGCFPVPAKDLRGRYHLRNRKEQHHAARPGRSRQSCAISGCSRFCTATYPVRNAGLTLLQNESRYSPSAEEIFPSPERSEQDFAPTGNPQRNPQTTAKEAFSEISRKGIKNGERIRLIREMLPVRIIRPVIRRKGKSTGSTWRYQSNSPFAAPVVTISGEKSIRRKKTIRKNTDSFFIFIVYTCRIFLQQFMK